MSDPEASRRESDPESRRPEPATLEEKSYRNSIRPETREVRYFLTPKLVTFRGMLETARTIHHVHTTNLRMTFRFANPKETYPLLAAYRAALPVVTPSKGKPTLTPTSIIFNVRHGEEYQDANHQYLRQTGEVTQILRSRPGVHRKLSVGAVADVVMLVRGVNSRGLETTILKISEGQETYFLTEWSPYVKELAWVRSLVEGLA